MPSLVALSYATGVSWQFCSQLTELLVIDECGVTMYTLIEIAVDDFEYIVT
jgi:hypothetical protein